MKNSKAPSDRKSKPISKKLMDEMIAFAEIREAIGDPEGKLMQDQVVNAVRCHVAAMRLLLKSIRVEDVGDDQVCPGVVIDHEEIEEALGPFARFDTDPAGVLASYMLAQVVQDKIGEKE